MHGQRHRHPHQQEVAATLANERLALRLKLGDRLGEVNHLGWKRGNLAGAIGSVVHQWTIRSGFRPVSPVVGARGDMIGAQPSLHRRVAGATSAAEPARLDPTPATRSNSLPG